MVSMKEVALHAGVSVATVSNVITGKRSVSENVRRKVLDSIEQMNYQVNLVARGLKTQRTNTIGVILPDITKLFFQKVIIGILEVASLNGYRINILSSSYDHDTERLLINMLKASCVDGIILDSCVSIDRARAWADSLEGKGGVMPPVVSLESRLFSDRLSSITMDNALYSGQITQHLIDGGRRKILYVSGPLHIEHERARFDGYRNCLLKNGIGPDPVLQKSGTYLSESGYNAVMEALNEGVRFDAVQASNDQAAIGALKILKERGFRVPDDVAISGFDNLFPSTLVSPAITTVDVPNYEMGAAAMRELLDRIEHPDAPPKAHVLDARIIVRASTVKDATSQWDLTNW